MDEFTRERVLEYFANQVETEITTFWKGEDVLNRLVYLAHQVVGERMTDETHKQLIEVLQSIENARNEMKKIKTIIFNLRKL